MADEVGLKAPVAAVGSHDTASAVVGVPAVDDEFAYVSCGTWALVGVELERPVLSEEARRANFTNEGGLDGRIRFLQNITGLWLQSESIRTWEREGHTIDLPTLLEAAAALPPGSLFDANHPRLLAPGDMPARIAQCCREASQAAPRTQAEFVRAINESLAEAFARAVRTAGELSGKTVRVIHIVGRRFAERAALPADRRPQRPSVIAGPVEATALGNVLVQARASRLLPGSLESLRSVIGRSAPLRRYEPHA